MSPEFVTACLGSNVLNNTEGNMHADNVLANCHCKLSEHRASLLVAGVATSDIVWLLLHPQMQLQILQNHVKA